MKNNGKHSVMILILAKICTIYSKAPCYASMLKIFEEEEQTDLEVRVLAPCSSSYSLPLFM